METVTLLSEIYKGLSAEGTKGWWFSLEMCDCKGLPTV